MKKIMLLVMLASVSFAFAGGFGFETGVEAVRESLSGTVATSVGVIAIVGAASMAAFNADNMSGSMKLFVGLAFVVGIALSANSIISKFGGGSASGALVSNAYIVKSFNA